jgi:SAM-dependent methyltransferase
VIDVGCGGGLLSEGMAALGAEVTGIDLSDKALGVARLHLYESGHKIDYRLIAAEAMAEEAPGSFRSRHLPGNAGTRARSGQHRRRLRQAGQAGRPGVPLHAESQCQGLSVVAVLGAEYVLNLLPRGTHEYTRFLKPAELARLVPAGRPGSRWKSPACATTPSRAKAWSARTPTSTTCSGPAQMPEAVLFDLDGTLADTAPDLGGALNQLLREQGRPELPLEQLRPHVSSGARGLIGAGLRHGSADPDYPALQQRFLAIYQDALCVGTRLFAGIGRAS